MKSLHILVGLFFILFICIIPLSRDIKEYDVQKNGELITATITYIPNCIGSKIRYFMKFTYAGQVYGKKVGCGFANKHKVGDTIKFKHTEGSDIFLFENENKETEFISTALLAALGICFIVIGVRKK